MSAPTSYFYEPACLSRNGITVIIEINRLR